MNFFDAACRVPLIVHAPHLFAHSRIAACVSLMDILPTLAEIAHDGAPPAYAASLDGKSLLPHLSGGDGHDEVLGEYLAEGAVAPLVMIRRGAYKFIHCPVDPDQLYDLAADPDELTNLTADPAHAARMQAFREEVAQRWDLERLKADVIASQARRRFVDKALGQGVQTGWDHQPLRDAGQLYMRNHMLLDDLERMARFPPVPAG
jgi:choline-sulfatase